MATESGTSVNARLSNRSRRRVTPYERLKQAIMVGELEPGDQMVESALAEMCGVSRTPIREALTRLEQDGLVERSERGLVVRDSSPEEILDVYDCKVVLEAQAACTAAERRTDRDVFAMRRAAERFSRLTADDPEGLAEGNREFHRALWRASHNDSLIDLQERLNLHLGRSPATTLSFPGRQPEASAEHVALIDAIEQRDARLAEDIARNHMMHARDIRMRLYQME